MSSVPAPASHSAAQLAANTQARAAADAVRDHRRAIATMANSRSGMCLANGWNVSFDELNGDFAIDADTVDRLLGGGPLQRGPWMSAAPAPRRAPAAPSGPSAAEKYLFPPAAAGAPGSLERLGEEAGGAVWGPGNIAANSTAALAGALQGVGEASGARRFTEGLRDILAGRAKVVTIAPNIELYNSAQGKQPPRVRLRVRGLPIKVVTQAIPATGGPVTQWRVNGPGTSASLKTGSMTPQQMRNAAVLAGEQKLPGVLRWASTKTGGGVLTFAPSMALDAYDAVEVDLQTGGRSFNTNKFLVAEARSQSGNAVGFVGGLVAVALVGGAIAGAPLVLLGLGVGIALQVAWNTSGMADQAGNLAQSALSR
jgi:hypothetical protein